MDPIDGNAQISGKGFALAGQKFDVLFLETHDHLGKVPQKNQDHERVSQEQEPVMEAGHILQPGQQPGPGAGAQVEHQDPHGCAKS
jgi:hypothetical protein